VAPRSDPQTDFSAGGVVLRDRQVIAIVPVKRSSDGASVLGLPKGHLDPGETPEQAATREVREETGVTAELIESLGEIQYRFDRRGRPVAKTVAFYLFRYLSGSVEDHDHEIERALWMPIEAAARELTYAGEREIVGRALSRIARER
jgi:mutator protein MutT